MALHSFLVPFDAADIAGEGVCFNLFNAISFLVFSLIFSMYCYMC